MRLENGIFVENDKDIANALNTFFTKVGPKLAEQLPIPEKTPDSYLRDSPINSFQINPTCSDEVLKVINSFTSSKCEGPDRYHRSCINLVLKRYLLFYLILLTNAF